jgi:hypothetical protein
VTNLLFRLVWTLRLYDIKISNEAIYFIVSTAEVLRRSQWLLIRIENDHENNPEKYRKYVQVPELP